MAVAYYRCQDVVEVMRYPPCKSPYGFKPLGMAEMFLEVSFVQLHPDNMNYAGYFAIGVKPRVCIYLKKHLQMRFKYSNEAAFPVIRH